MSATVDFVCLDHKPVRLQQKNKRIPFRLIVVDDANDFFARHAPQPLFDG